MNKQDAIGYLEDLLTTCDCVNFHCGRYDEAIKMGISALEKQIPKNVIIENGWKYCPACYGCLNDDYGTETNYCSDCGQRLEW